jgi:large subunit ribosomal protein L13e
LPIAREKPSVELVKVTEEMKSFQAYDKLRLERTNQRHVDVKQMSSRREPQKQRKKRRSSWFNDVKKPERSFAYWF